MNRCGVRPPAPDAQTQAADQAVAPRKMFQLRRRPGRKFRYDGAMLYNPLRQPTVPSDRSDLGLWRRPQCLNHSRPRRLVTGAVNTRRKFAGDGQSARARWAANVYAYLRPTGIGPATAHEWRSAGRKGSANCRLRTAAAAEWRSGATVADNPDH
jgi:hypothetical protein